MIINFFKKIYYEKYSKKSHSISNVDLIIDRLFSKIEKGVYLDVGCNHPIKFNNTYLLHKKGWNGINLDINFYSIELFNFLRKKDVNIHSGISKKKDELTMYYRKEINMLNTLDEKIAKIHFRNGYKKKNIQVNTLNFFISKKFKKLNKIDFINIDVEGHELDALKSLNFSTYKPQLICIEIHNIKKMYDTNYKYLKSNDVYNYLINKKYKVIWKNKYSFIFERKNNEKN